MGAIFLWCSDMFLIWQALVKLCECHVGSSRLFWDDFGWFRHWAFSCSLPCRSMETGNVGSWGLNDKIRCIDHTYFSNWCRYKKDTNKLTCPTKHMYYHIIIYMCVLRGWLAGFKFRSETLRSPLYPHYIHIISTLYPHYIHIISTLYPHYIHIDLNRFAQRWRISWQKAAVKMPGFGVLNLQICGIPSNAHVF